MLLVDSEVILRQIRPTTVCIFFSIANYPCCHLPSHLKTFNSPLSHTRCATKGGVFPLLVVICQLLAARCIVPAETRACWEPAVHFWAAFQGVGVSHGSSSSPFLSSFAAFWGGQPRVGSLFWRALLTHLHSLELELLHNSPWCRHRLLRAAVRYTSLHALHCTIPPTHSFTSQLRTPVAAGKQNTPSHHISLPRRGTWTPAEMRR